MRGACVTLHKRCAVCPVVGVVERARRAHGLGQRLGKTPLRVGKHHEDRAEVGPGGVQYLEAIFLGGGAGVLVGQHDPVARIDGPEAGQKPETAQGPSLDRKGLFEHVEGRLRIRGQEAKGSPPRESGPRLGIAGFARSAVQDDPYDVPRVASVKLVLEGGRDHVVGGGEHARQLGLGHAVEDAGKGLDLGQGISGRSCSRPCR